MTDLKPQYTINIETALREVHFSVAGFFSLEQMKAFLHELDSKARVLVQPGAELHALGDMSRAMPQSADVAEYLRKHLLACKEAGLTRIAIIAPPLVRMQYKRLSEGLEVEFFDDADAAKTWLRR